MGKKTPTLIFPIFGSVAAGKTTNFFRPYFVNPHIVEPIHIQIPLTDYIDLIITQYRSGYR